ncbi:dTDP-4-dehydrorhamnose reductase [hydrothermal vent metagenome]|uniref:dTDP-4-dehydrorhamnose reductase n=1 Tax=hydrothermal vent metagenome TaxID=652676 RepID=A0A3B1CZK7_9ZZZZ
MISEENLIKNRIMVLGSNGMLGQGLTQYFMFKRDVELFCASFEDSSFFPKVEYSKVDISSPREVKHLINDFCPDVVINAAAYTNVDGCESEKELAWKVNVTGVENIVKYIKGCKAHLIHMSSDYIFDGTAGPYHETDLPSPISYYGKTKLAAENAILSNNVHYTIIRTNVLYGPTRFGRPDFVKWVVNSLRDQKQIRIVNDQFNNPTYIDDLISAIAKIIEAKKKGIYNIGGSQLLSRLEFTYKIADYFDLDKSLITEIITAELHQPAPRPLKSGLVNLKAETELGYRPHKIDETLFLMKRYLNGS